MIDLKIVNFFLMNFNYAILLLTIILLFFYRKKIPESLNFICYYFVLCAISEMSLIVLMKLKMNNLFVVPIFATLEFLLFSILFTKFFFKKSTRFLLIVQIAVLTMLSIINYYFFKLDQAQIFQAYGKVLVNSCIIFYTLKYFMGLASGEFPLTKYKISLAIIIFVYCLFGAIFFVSINFLVNEDSVLITSFWFFYNITILSFYSSIFYITWQAGKNPRHLQFG